MATANTANLNPETPATDRVQALIGLAHINEEDTRRAHNEATADLNRLRLARTLLRYDVPANHTFTVMNWGRDEPDHIKTTALAIDGVVDAEGYNDAFDDIDWDEVVFESAATIKRGRVTETDFDIFKTHIGGHRHSVAKVYDWVNNHGLTPQ